MKKKKEMPKEKQEYWNKKRAVKSSKKKGKRTK